MIFNQQQTTLCAEISVTTLCLYLVMSFECKMYAENELQSRARRRTSQRNENIFYKCVVVINVCPDVALHGVFMRFSPAIIAPCDMIQEFLVRLEDCR